MIKERFYKKEKHYLDTQCLEDTGCLLSEIFTYPFSCNVSRKAIYQEL